MPPDSRLADSELLLIFLTMQEKQMSVHTSRSIQVLAAAAILAAGLSGCASNTKMQSQIDAAAADAAAAKADAASANATAAEALRTANEAKAIAEDTETKIDRMFKKSMHK
jgi:murein lipoprotein